MKKTFEGYNEAVSFAQSESRKLGKKTYVFITRKAGIQYVVTDTENFKSVDGKLRKEFGQDPALRPFAPPPEIKHSPGVIVSAPEKEEAAIEEEKPVLKNPIDSVSTGELDNESKEEVEPKEKPKKTRKKKSDE